ncbi:hypothetical protein [Streptomyces sp. NPDC059018]
MKRGSGFRAGSPSAGSMDLTFTDHDKPVDTTPPPPGQILAPTGFR